jgi:hypothetical protein
VFDCVAGVPPKPYHLEIEFYKEVKPSVRWSLCFFVTSSTPAICAPKTSAQLTPQSFPFNIKGKQMGHPRQANRICHYQERSRKEVLATIVESWRKTSLVGCRLVKMDWRRWRKWKIEFRYS